MANRIDVFTIKAREIAEAIGSSRGRTYRPEADGDMICPSCWVEREEEIKTYPVPKPGPLLADRGTDLNDYFKCPSCKDITTVPDAELP